MAAHWCFLWQSSGQHVCLQCGHPSLTPNWLNFFNNHVYSGFWGQKNFSHNIFLTMIEIFWSPKPWIDMTITIFLRVNEQRNILHEIRKQKANWMGHILCRNCLLKQVIEGKIKGEMEVTRRWGRRSRKLLDDLKDRRGYSHLKEEALDRTMWRNCFAGGFGPVVRQNTEWMIFLTLCISLYPPTFIYTWVKEECKKVLKCPNILQQSSLIHCSNIILKIQGMAHCH